MNELREINTNDFSCNPFNMIGKDWMLITAENNNKVNTMTASWGGMGVLWEYDVVYIFIRNSRFTKEFIDASPNFSLTFYDTDKYHKTMGYLGSVSGRTEDKIAKSELTLLEEDGIPYFAEANTVILCEKLSRQKISPEGMLNDELLPKYYADHDYHEMYIGKILKIMQK